MNNWGITKRVLKTDQDLEEAVYNIDTPGIEIVSDLDIVEDEEIQSQLDAMANAPGRYFSEEWKTAQRAQDEACMDKLLSTELGKRAYESTYHVDLENNAINAGNIQQAIPNYVIEDFYKNDEYEYAYSVLQGNLSHMW